MKCLYHLSIIGVWMFCTAAVEGAVINIPDDYPNIQVGIDAAEDGDTVLIADGIYRGPGNTNIQIASKSITVKSTNGPECCLIDCEGTAQGIVLSPGSNGLVWGLTISGGSAVGQSGGGILCDSNCTITNCVFTACTAKKGGAIYTSIYSAPLISNCQFIDNSSLGSGSGMYVDDCSPTIIDCTFTGNHARTGGGIYIVEGSPEISNCIFTDNSASSEGGALAIDFDADPLITHCQFIGNSAREVGGAIYLDDSAEPVIGGSSEVANYFCDNSAPQGADLGCDNEPDNPFNATHNVFANNWQSDYYVSPGVFYDLGGSTSETELITTDVYVAINGADTNDGLTWDTPFKTIHHAYQCVLGTEENPLIIHVGEGLFSESTTGELFPLPLIPYVSVIGKGMELTVLDVEQSGQAMVGYLDESCRIESLTCMNARRSALHITETYAIVENCMFRANSSDFGGGISCFYKPGPEIRNCVITQNTASLGGGINVFESDVIISGCLIFDNEVTRDLSGGEGGGVRLDRSQARIVDCNFSQNRAYSGAGIYATDGQTIINSCRVNENYADRYGGGLMLSTQVQGTATIKNCLITANEANSGAGIACTNNLNITMRYTTISDNISQESGGGMRLKSLTEGDAIGCIIWGNLPDSIYIANTTGVEITHSNVESGFPGEGNIDADPLFIANAMGSYYLSHMATGQEVDSPCLNRGHDLAESTCYVWCLDELTTRTDQVFDEGISDMGYHYSYRTPFPTPSATPHCDASGVTLFMPAKDYLAGDPCYLTAQICNDTSDLLQHIPFFCLLEVSGTYWYYPSWNTDPDWEVLNEISLDVTNINLIPEFLWPDNVGTGSGVSFISAITNSELTEVIGSMDTFEFEFH